MFRIISLAIIIFGLFSCKTQYASFQSSSIENLNPKNKKSWGNSHTELAKPKGVKIVTVTQPEIPTQLFAEPPMALIIKPEKPSFDSEWKPTSFSHDYNTHSGDPKPKKKKNNGRRFRKISSNLFIGFVFLAIAITLAFFEVPTLVTLFGIASIIFLAIGLKKVWKKKKRKSWFRDTFNKKK